MKKKIRFCTWLCSGQRTDALMFWTKLPLSLTENLCSTMIQTNQRALSLSFLLNQEQSSIDF